MNCYERGEEVTLTQPSRKGNIQTVFDTSRDKSVSQLSTVVQKRFGPGMRGGAKKVSGIRHLKRVIAGYGMK